MYPLHSERQSHTFTLYSGRPIHPVFSPNIAPKLCTPTDSVRWSSRCIHFRASTNFTRLPCFWLKYISVFPRLWKNGVYLGAPPTPPSAPSSVTTSAATAAAGERVEPKATEEDVGGHIILSRTKKRAARVEQPPPPVQQVCT